VDAASLVRVDEQLDSFVGEIFSHLGRKDRRATAGLYVRGLMLDGRRKSMQPMAARLRVDHQRLQQFVTSSPWDVEPAGKTLSRRACALIEPDAWVIDDTGFVKDGDASPCVARQYSGTLGKVGNCQVAVSVHAVSDAASAPLDWRLFVPQRWDDRCADAPADAAAATGHRQRSGIPDTERHRPKWQMALEMIDELIEWGRTPPVVCADAGSGDTTALRQGLTDRQIGYVVAVKGATSAYPADATPQRVPYTGRGRPFDAALPRPAFLLQRPRRSRRPRRLQNGDLAPRHQNRPRQPYRGDALPIPGRGDPPGKPRHHRSRRRQPAASLAARRMAHRR